MTRYLAIVHRESCTYSRCSRGCCGTGHTDGLFEKLYSEERSEIVRFLVNSHIKSANESDSEERYGERTHLLSINGLPEDEWADEFSDEDAEKRKLLSEMEAIKAEVKAEVEIRLAAAKAKEIEDKRIADEKQIVEQRKADLRQLENLERQKEALQARLAGAT